MSRWKVFSRRVREAARPEHEIYVFDNIPENVRWRLFYAFCDTFRDHYDSDQKQAGFATAAHGILLRDYGRPDLAGKWKPDEDLCQFMFAANTEKYIDVIETLNMLLLAQVDTLVTQEHWDGWRDRANQVFDEERIGYQIQGPNVVRVDSQYAHREMVKPALGLLSEHGFEAALREFTDAHEAYRHGDFAKAISRAEQAVESTMKCALARLGKPLPKLETAGPLTDACLECGLIPEWSEAAPKQLADLLKAGLPNVRNKLPVTHGAGDIKTNIDRSSALLALHLSASYIVFLGERLKELKS